MPRISREAAAAKESFVLGLLATNPALSNKELQDAIKTQFGGVMNANKVKELRDRAAGTTPQTSPIVANTPDTETAFTASTTTFTASTETVTPTETAASTEGIVEPEPAQTAEVQLAPPPVKEVQKIAPPVKEVVDPVDPVIIPMEQVTDANGTYIRKPVEDTRPRKTIAPGLEEVVTQ